MTKPRSKRPYIIGTIVLVAAGTWFAWPKSGNLDAGDVPTFTVQRGTLQINVLQGGEIRALKNYEVKSEIETPTKILSLVSEGTLITEDDVKDGKILVELDGSDIKDKITTHEIEFQTTVAAFIDADENREIVRSENQSLERDQKNTAMFALMDFQKYLGKEISARILREQALPENVESFEKDVMGMQAAVRPSRPNVRTTSAEAEKKKPAEAPKPAAPARKVNEFVRRDYLPFLDGDKSTDGDAQQKFSQLKGELLLHQGELEQARDTLANSKTLSEKSFITKGALKTDEVNFEKIQLSVRTADIALDLFRRYEFPKQCEQYLSAYQEALQKLQRLMRANRSKMAQAESKFETAKRRYDMELTKKEDLDRQLKACTIHAQQPGLVAYGPINSSTIRYSEPIEEGAAVRLRQTILTIPDMSQMGVHVSVHESQIKKVKLGQRVRVRVDAEPGKELYGNVAEVAVLPDSSSSRYTPNLKVYPSNVHIDGTHDWLKPGMNAKVEIIVDELADVLYVPVQSIEVDDDHHFCYINQGGDLQRREIATGSFNDEFIQVLKGISPGELVSLTVPKRSVLDDLPDESLPGAKKPALPKKSDPSKKEKKTVAKS